ncbi:hypothetical protein Efla_004828 [Eimeria flavescens]
MCPRWLRQQQQQQQQERQQQQQQKQELRLQEEQQQGRASASGPTAAPSLLHANLDFVRFTPCCISSNLLQQQQAAAAAAARRESYRLKLTSSGRHPLQQDKQTAGKAPKSQPHLQQERNTSHDPTVSCSCRCRPADQHSRKRGCRSSLPSPHCGIPGLRPATSVAAAAAAAAAATAATAAAAAAVAAAHSGVSSGGNSGSSLRDTATARQTRRSRADTRQQQQEQQQQGAAAAAPSQQEHQPKQEQQQQQEQQRRPWRLLLSQGQPRNGFAAACCACGIAGAGAEAVGAGAAAAAAASASSAVSFQQQQVAMSSVGWTGGGGGGWGPSSSGSLRSGSSLLVREQWVRLALLSGNYPDLLLTGAPASSVAARRRAQTASDEADEFLNWIFVFGLMTVVYSLSRYFARRHHLGEFDQRNVGERIPRPPVRPTEPPSFIRRIDTWCPAKTYSAVLSEHEASNGGSPSGVPPGAPPGASPGATRGSSASGFTEIEMTEQGGPAGRRPVGPPGASGPPISDAEKEGLGRFIESGCAICFEEFSPSVLVRVLPCRHIFHMSCLDTWFQRSAMCPLCMHDYSRGPPPSAAPAAARGASGGSSGAPDTTAARFISFRFFSFPGRMRQQR